MQEPRTESVVELASATPSPETSGEGSPPSHTEDINLDTPRRMSWHLTPDSNPRLLIGSRVTFRNVSGWKGPLTLQFKDSSGNAVFINRLFDTSSNEKTLDVHPSTPTTLDVRMDAPHGAYQLHARINDFQAWQRLSDIEVICDPKERDCTD
ncbi:hypothetical protein [Pyxidicoccus xibeiensis]|uniref:hypothetical protein n=1 Tax=Pyxidicoccus xibeiensis TaxID=2906759 RepID=UPI0020A7037F|nr:hypothetical protein [Pyxidicoccus xibeiensis]MCP3142806.1 hypothetical protein [Pyxidicoccus xibeiensis]